MHHAALLLGYDIALGHGREGIFRHLPEFTVGTELGETVRYGNPEEREGAIEAHYGALSVQLTYVSGLSGTPPRITVVRSRDTSAHRVRR